MKNQELASRFVNEALAQGNQQTFMDLVHEDVVVYSGLEPMNAIRGRAGIGKTGEQ